MSDAFDRIEGPSRQVVLTCEHASARLPEPYRWGDDAWIVGTHWSYDIGAADLTADLAAALGASAVRSRFSRLLCDPNRPVGSPTMFVREAEGRTLELNRDLTDDDIGHRLTTCYQPFHDAVDAAVASRPGAMVLSVHSFTPVFRGQARDFHVGVLFDDDEVPARRLADRLAAAGLSVRVNDPYSGQGGFMFSASDVARRHQRVAIELEIRQDVCASPPWRARFAALLAATL